MRTAVLITNYILLLILISQIANSISELSALNTDKPEIIAFGFGIITVDALLLVPVILSITYAHNTKKIIK